MKYSYEHGNDPSMSMKDGDRRDEIRDYSLLMQLLKGNNYGTNSITVRVG
jgi:hypothetical protein